MPVITLPDQRQAAIQQRLQRDGRVLAADLAREFATSEDTIRRDLRELAAAGICRRVYGGALPISPVSGSIAERFRRDPDVKAALGRAAAGLVRAGQVICIDASSTNTAIAQALPDGLGLTVITNAPAVAAALGPRNDIEVILIGGRLDRRSGGTIGVRTMRDVMTMRPDLYFIGACAADPQDGLAIFDAEEAELKRTLVANSGAVAVAVTDDKLGTSAPHRVAAWHDVDYLVLTGRQALARCGLLPPDGPAISFAANAKGAP